MDFEDFLFGVGCILAAPVVAVIAIESAAVLGAVAVTVGVSEALVVGAGAAAASSAEGAMVTHGVRKILGSFSGA